MNYYKFIYFTWLLPLSFLFLLCHQAAVYQSIKNTYKNGNSYTAIIEDLEVKQIATQHNNSLKLKFKTDTGKTIRRKLSLPVEMVANLQHLKVLPIRYRAEAFEDIVIMPAFKTQKQLVWTNIGIAFAGLLITFFIALAAHRFATKKINSEDTEVIYERVD